MYKYYTKMSLTKEQLEIQKNMKQNLIEKQLKQQIKYGIDSVLEFWVNENINDIVVDFDLCYVDYMKSLINKNEDQNSFRAEIENKYLNELILKTLKNRQLNQERANKYKPYSKKPKA